MMLYRNINNVDFAIDPNSANQIFFEKTFLKQKRVHDIELTPANICNLIADESFFPMFMSWEIIDKCNFNCPFCYIVGHSGNRTIRFKETKPHLKKLIEKGLLYVNLTGGEVLTHPDFIEIYTFLKKSGVLVEIFSNGYLLSEEILKVFIEYPPYKIEVSIYGVSQKEYNKNTNTTGGNYKTVLENVIILKENDINVICKTPLNSLTEKSFNKISLWCDTHSIKFYYSTDIYDAYDGTNLSNYASSYKKNIEYEVKKIKENERKYPDEFNILRKTKPKQCFNCSVKNYGFHVSSDFSLKPCSAFINNESSCSILKYGITECLKQNRNFVYQHLNKTIIGCNSCEASSICKLCPPKADAIYADEEIIGFRVPDGYCENQIKQYNSIINSYINYKNKSQ